MSYSRVDVSLHDGARPSAANLLRVAVTRGFLLLGILLPALPLQAQPLDVQVTMLTKSWSNCEDGITGLSPDPRYEITIDGTRRVGPETTDPPLSFFDVEERFEQSVNLASGTVNVQIELWDDDDPFSDQQCAVTSTGGNVLSFTIDLLTCTVSGGVNGHCGDRFHIVGAGIPSSNPNLYMDFTVDVQQPVAAPGLNVRCTHDPLWPQPGQDVTITAEALDGAMAPKQALLEVWANNTAAPVKTMANAFQTVFTLVAPAGDDFSYGCRAVDLTSQVAWTGWRRTAIGQPAALTAAFDGRIPLIFNGARGSAWDIVFYHDAWTYTDVTDPIFIADTTQLVKDALLNDDLYLQNQRRVNLWLAFGQGRADVDCVMETSDQTLWEDASTVVHRDDFRDCSFIDDRILTVSAGKPNTFSHELGHVLFGLADEYSRSGGYFEQSSLPNIYQALYRCEEDAATLGRNASTCRAFHDDNPWWEPDSQWWTSDPGERGDTLFDDDLMVDNGPRNLLDFRRINAMYLACTFAGC